MSSEKRDVLRRVRVFANLNDDDCDRVLGVLKARRGSPGDVLFRQGDPGTSLIVVLEGQLVCTIKTDAGEEEVSRIGPGEVVGELAFLDSEPRSASVSSPAGATVLEFSRESLEVLKRDAPNAAAVVIRNVLADLTRRLRDIGERMIDDAGGAAPMSMRGADVAQRSMRPVTGEQLRSVRALESYTAEDLDLLAHISTLRSFQGREALMTEGTSGDSCYLLLSGVVDVVRSSVPTPIAALGAGSIVGQLALIDRAPRSASVIARTDVMALEIRGAAFANLVKRTSPLALRLQEQVALAAAKQLRLANQKYAELASVRSVGPSSIRTLDDWDDGGAPTLELAVDLRSIRR